MIDPNKEILRLCLMMDLDLNEIRSKRQAHKKTMDTLNKLGGLASAW